MTMLVSDTAGKIVYEQLTPVVMATVDEEASTQPLSWIGTPYNPIEPNDPFGQFLVFGYSFIIMNLAPALPLLGGLIPVILSYLPIILSGNLVESFVETYEESLVAFFCILIAIGRWIDNILFLKRYAE